MNAGAAEPGIALPSVLPSSGLVELPAGFRFLDPGLWSTRAMPAATPARARFTAAITHTVEADVSAEAIWSLYHDVTTWPAWDEQAELVTRDGPFAAGTTGTMKFVGQDPLLYRLANGDVLEPDVRTPVIVHSGSLDDQWETPGFGA